MVQILYKLFLAAMVALFIGFGVSVFYAAPKAPDYPTQSDFIGKDGPTAEQQKTQSDYDAQQKEYRKKFETYNRNISSIILGLSIILLILSLTILIKIDIFGDGVLLGGLFTLVYGIIRGFMSNESKFQFVVVTIGLIVALALGYIKFIRRADLKSK